MNCPDDNELSEFVAGSLPKADIERVETHLDACEGCRTVLAEVARAVDPDPAGAVTDASWPVEGYLGGRYVPESILGAGGMSIVYEGRDRVLRRRVALKVMLDAPEDVRARLRREARALGMLSHPNVVDVYDVDLSGSSAFLACELVDGGTLRAWLAKAPRTCPEVLGLIIDAARGLQAAHQVGLIHRDVTPNNILVGSDGRGRVADFGLVRLPDELSPDTVPSDRHEPCRPGGGTTGLGGTPGYLAPEVCRGLAAGPPADQYGLGVTAYEALHGRLPGEPTGARLGRSAVPRAVDRVLRRALAQDPADRFESIAAFQRALEAAHKSPRARAPALALTAAALASLAWYSHLSPPSTCGQVAARTAKAVALADLDIAAPVADAAARYAAQWEAVRVRACAASDAAAVPARVLDLRWACLRARGREFSTVLDRLADARDASDVGATVVVLEGLRPAVGCEDDDALREGLALPPDLIATQVEAVRDGLAAVQLARSKVGVAEASQLLEPLQVRAEALQYDPLLVEVLGVRATLAGGRGHLDHARELLQDAAHLAAGANLNLLAADAWLRLLALEGYDRMDYDAAVALQPLVDASLARAGNPAAMVAKRAQVLGSIYDRQTQYDRAAPYYDEALRIIEELYGADSLRLSRVLSRAGVHNARAGKLVLATKQLTRALAIARALLGVGTPAEADHLTNLAGLAITRLQFKRAVNRAREALAIRERDLAPDDPRIGMLLGLIGQGLTFDNSPVQAIPYLERALAIRTSSVPLSHPAVIDAHYQLAVAYDDAARYDDADRILSLAEAELDGPAVTREQRGIVLHGRGRLWASMGRDAESAAMCERAIDVLADPPLQPWLKHATDCRDTARDKLAAR